MFTQDQLREVVGSTAYDSDGDKIGKVGNIYYDDATDQPKWLTVNTGLFGTNETFVPVQGADVAGDGRVTLTYDKGMVKDAPNVSEDGYLSPEEEQRLYSYYGLDSDYATTTGGDFDADRERGTGQHVTDQHATDQHATDQRGAGHDTSGPNTDEAMTRSEEQLRVGTEQRETGRARLRKHVVTEDVSTTVPVSHEEVTLEREPITEANRGEALSGGDLTEEEHEVTLTEQRAVVDKDVVPVERVRLGTETVTGQEQVDETVRKEVIETDGVEGNRVAERDVTDRDVADPDVARRDR